MSDDEKKDLIPEPDASSDEVEQARAKSFGELVDGLLAGESTPVALTPDHRDLLEAATMVRASNRDAELDSKRRASLIERALADAMKVPTAIAPVADPPTPLPADVTPLRPRRVLRAVPWVAATVAAAAALLLALSRPDTITRTETVVIETPKLSAMHRSRPADPLIGKIERIDSGRASERLDMIFADRMTGYR